MTGVTVPALEKLSQDVHVRLGELGDEEDDLPTAAAHCRQTHLDDVTQGSHETVPFGAPTMTRFASGWRTRLYSDHDLLPAMSSNSVVALVTSSEVLLRVVDDVIPIDRAVSTFLVLQTPVTSASERLGDAHGERAHASGCAVDQDLLPGLEAPSVAETLESRESGDGDGRRLIERQVRGLRHDGSLLA